MKEMLFNIDGMSCDHCVQTLRSCPKITYPFLIRDGFGRIV